MDARDAMGRDMQMKEGGGGLEDEEAKAAVSAPVDEVLRPKPLCESTEAEVML